MEESKRSSMTYRSQLKWEWDNSDDTSQGFMPLISQERLYQQKKDALLKDDKLTWKDKPYSQMTERDWRIFREDHEICIRGGKAPDPVRDWRDIRDIDPILL